MTKTFIHPNAFANTRAAVLSDKGKCSCLSFYQHGLAADKRYSLDKMNNTQRVMATQSAAERFFRAYHAHCTTPDLDSLFNLLNASHSLNDKMRKEYSSDFFSLKEFVAIKALRNLFHHQEELIHEVRIVDTQNLAPIKTDLLFLCLAPRLLVDKAIDGIEKRRKAEDEHLVRNALKWYGNVVNINPCIFNFAVHVFERIEQLNISLVSEDYLLIRKSYEFEELHGHSHFVTGDIECHAGSINVVFQTIFADVK